MSETTALARVEAAVQLGTLQATSGAGLIEAASKLATPLRDMIEKTGSSMPIPGRGKRPYVMVDGWTTLATMCGVTPRTVSVEAKDGVYTAVVELRTINTDEPIGRATAECGGPEEPMWAKRPPNARLSMAQTRATGKACRMVFSWVMVLAGYEPTPYEEVKDLEGEVVSAAPDPPTTKAPRHGSVVATEAPEMPFDGPEDPEAYYITKVEPKTAKNGKSTYWTLTFNRAVTAEGSKLANVSPFLPDVAALAVDAAKHHWPVIADVVQEGKYTNIVALEVTRE